MTQVQVIHTKTRPARIAICVSPHASNRVIRRAFRLLGGRWGGVHDLLVIVDKQGRLDQFFGSSLRLADPDFILPIDRNLDSVNWGHVLEKLRLQPFDVVRFRERMELRVPWSPLFVERPSRPGRRGAVIDVDDQALTWRDAARFGLPFSKTRARRRSKDNPEAERPVERGAMGLTAQSTAWRWAIFGDPGQLDLAARFWCLRALGGSPRWFSLRRLDRPRPPILSRQAFLFAPEATDEAVALAAERWTSGARLFKPAPDDPSDVLDGPADYYFGTKIDAIEAFNQELRTSLPAPPVLGEPLRRDLMGVTEYHLLSPDPEDPDGIVLARDARSRALVNRHGKAKYQGRITLHGFAEVRPIVEPALAVLPEIKYEAAVAAPLEEAGYLVRRSDKGLYQQRSLALAGGLKFLAWALRQPESADLLALFHEYHRSGTPPPSYRRAITYEDLLERLFNHLRQRRKRLRPQLRESAEQWLSWWVNELLEKRLLTAGYVLPCPTCALREFYRAESVGQTFECQRCGDRASVRSPLARSFRLNEAFYQLQVHDGEVVTLLLASLREASKASFLYLPEAELTKQGQTREADALALVDGDLVLAEAKSNDSLSTREVDWYRYAAQRTKARRLLFATTSQNRPLCKALDCDKCALTGAHHRDYAWNEATKARLEDARKRLSTHGIEVETVCYHSLVVEQGIADGELSRFERRQ